MCLGKWEDWASPNKRRVPLLSLIVDVDLATGDTLLIVRFDPGYCVGVCVWVRRWHREKESVYSWSRLLFVQQKNGSCHFFLLSEVFGLSD